MGTICTAKKNIIVSMIGKIKLVFRLLSSALFECANPNPNLININPNPKP